ncbi:MAG: PHP domain-containing protein, partial [Desulfobacterales bacterium]
MELMDYHNHHWRCGHAKHDIEDYIKAAIDKGLSEIGIADHFPYGATTDDPKFEELPRENTGMKVKEFPEYIQEIKDLRDKYKGQIHVKISTEVAFVSSGQALDRQKAVLEPFMDDFDYLLCGLHSIKPDGVTAIPFSKEKGPEILRAHGEDKIHMAYIT